MDTTDGFSPQTAMEECMAPPEQLVNAVLTLAHVTDTRLGDFRGKLDKIAEMLAVPTYPRRLMDIVSPCAIRHVE